MLSDIPDRPFEQSHSLGSSARRRRSAREFVLLALAIGMLVGFGLGWVSFASPWSYVELTSALYDEDLVTSVFERSAPAVVEISVSRPGRRSPVNETTGSGFLIDRKGHIVTNNHVIAWAKAITVNLNDGRSLTATLLGSSPADDLAILEIDPREVRDVEPLVLADSDLLKPGQLAIAIGSPFREFNSLTVGLVAGVGRSEPRDLGSAQGSILRRPVADLVQTTATLNPGNSGGPLLDSKGRVIGVNSAIQVSRFGRTGIGFAVSSNTVRSLLPDLMQPGVVSRPWLGVGGRSLSRNLSAVLGLPVEKGVYISSVMPGSPAARARLRGDTSVNPLAPSGDGDVIVALDNEPVDSISDIVTYLNSRKPGDLVVITIFRDEASRKVDVTLAAWPDT